jgi:hypothetical protein
VRSHPRTPNLSRRAFQLPERLDDGLALPLLLLSVPRLGWRGIPLPFTIPCSNICPASDVPQASRRANSRVFSGAANVNDLGRGGLQDSVETALPAATKEERHENRVVRLLCIGTCSIGEHKAKISSGMPRRGPRVPQDASAGVQGADGPRFSSGTPCTNFRLYGVPVHLWWETVISPLV